MNLAKNKFICPACMGNGYRKIFKDSSSNLRVVIDCEACNNEGEIHDSNDFTIIDADGAHRMH